MDQQFQCSDGAAAEGGRQLSGDFVVADRIHFPSNATETLAAILKVGLGESLKTFVLSRVNVDEGLGVAKDEFVGCDAYDRAMSPETVLYSPGVSTREPNLRALIILAIITAMSYGNQLTNDTHTKG